MNDKAPIQLNVRLDPATHRQLKIHAVMHGISMNTLLSRAVETILKGEPRGDEREAA